MITRALTRAVSIYQLFLSPLLGHNCRFYPSCSDYFKVALVELGPYRGVLAGLSRIMRCGPWDPGGYDPPVFKKEEALQQRPGKPEISKGKV